MISSPRYVALIALLCALGALAGCASTKVQPSVMIPASEALSRPTRIAVYEFAVAAHDVSQNNALLSRLRRVFGGSQSEGDLKVGRSVAGALSVAEADAKRTAEQLAKQIKEIFAARGWSAARPPK